MPTLADGKLPAELLRSLLSRLPRADPSVLLGPGEGEDAAAVRLPGVDAVVIAAADPVTFPTPEPGWYAVQVNANDIATRGARPRWFLATLLLPSHADDGLAVRLVDEIVAACREVDVSLIGGHTEVTSAVARPVVCGTMLGTLDGRRLLRCADAQAGDRLLLTHGVAIEGSAVLGSQGALLAGRCSPELLEQARAMLRKPGISVVPAALLAARTPGVHALHDPTEGGLATAVHELCDAAGVGVVVRQAAVPVIEETRALCELLQLDPLGLLASGALLAAVDGAAAPRLLAAWHESGIPAHEIGRLIPGTVGRTLETAGASVPLPRFARDELARFLATSS